MTSVVNGKWAEKTKGRTLNVVSSINVYLTEFIFGVRVHHTEFPFKSSRVSDNKRFVSCERSVME